MTALLETPTYVGDEGITTLNAQARPATYRGLAAFHKYWGKKPIEALRNIISLLSDPGDIVVDPFLGHGLLSVSAIEQQRRFLGIDLNPIAVELARLSNDLPSRDSLQASLASIIAAARSAIEDSYCCSAGVATHYLWNQDSMSSVWVSARGRKARTELTPSQADLRLYREFDGYESHNIRPLRLFKNSRINTGERVGLQDVFTGRALRNIDLILDAIRQQPLHLQRALTLCVTSSIGQMSKMVFAITGRGKTKGVPSARTEVGSWVVGYWRPLVHFEINVWACFESRVTKLLKFLPSTSGSPAVTCGCQTTDILNPSTSLALCAGDAATELRKLPSESVALVLTDPPHADRVPYLEMSELWNAVLGEQASFDSEIVVSNAIGREKTLGRFCRELGAALDESARILKPQGFLCVVFNARSADDWGWLRAGLGGFRALVYKGCLPVEYSATSVIQDNRAGSMKNDFALFFQKGTGPESERLLSLKTLPTWRETYPPPHQPELNGDRL